MVITPDFESGTVGSNPSRTIPKINFVGTLLCFRDKILLELGIEPRSGACEAPVLTVIRFELMDILLVRFASL